MQKARKKAKRGAAAIFALLTALAGARVALAAGAATEGLADTNAAPGPAVAHMANNPIGLGLMMSADDSERTVAAILEGANHFKQRTTSYGIRQYGFAQSRLELGNHVGVSFAALSGVTLVGIDGDEWIAPHVGVEPFSLQITWNTSTVRQSFYDWFPMGSFGPQLALGGCRGLAEARAGGALGNLGKAGFWPDARPAYGGALLLNCERFDFGIELTRIQRDDSPNLLALDFGIPFGLVNNWKLGLRAEALSYGTVSSNLLSTAPPSDSGERRVMLVFRGNPFDPF